VFAPLLQFSCVCAHESLSLSLSLSLSCIAYCLVVAIEVRNMLNYIYARE